MTENYFQELRTTYQIDLNQQQKQAVTHKDGPCLLLAVPGGGKTTTLLCRTAYLIKEMEVPAERLLTITFSRASANDMKERFEHIFHGTIPGKVRFSTIHSFAYGVVMNHMKSVNKKYTLIEGNQQAKLSKGRILRQIYHQVAKNYISEGDYETLVNDLSYVKNAMLSDQEIKSFNSDVSSFYQCYKAYEAYKRAEWLMDFDDMLTLCHEVLSEQARALYYYQKRYDYVQVDEAQDTSRLQHAIIALLVKEKKNILYVADDDQSIYGFRGASPTYLLTIQQTYPKAQVLRMERNYRSTGAIVRMADAFIKKNLKRYDKQIYTEQEDGLPVLIHEVPTRQEQYLEILKSLDHLEDFSLGAVLYRNNHSAVSMIHALSKTDIPFKLRGLKRRFFDHWVVIDLLNMLYFAQAREDLHCFKSFYYKLRGYYISKQMLEEIQVDHDGRTVFERLMASHNLASYQINNLKQMVDDFDAILGKSVYDGIEFLLTEMGYLDFLMDRAGGRSTTFDAYNMMIEIVKDLAKSSDSLSTLKASIADLEKLIHQASENSNPQALTLSTVHSAKGLEWSKVFMIDLVSGIFPSKDVIEATDPSAMEEERRLFYVGMTRAKTDLVLYKAEASVPSPFLEEVSKILNPKYKGLTKAQPLGQTIDPRATYGLHEQRRSDHQAPLAVGTEVVHRVYGHGIVKSCSKERILLAFEGGDKQLNYGFCMAQGLLSIC